MQVPSSLVIGRRKLDSQTTCGVPFVSLHLALHTRAGFRHSDLAFIVGMWDRLADEIKARLIEMVSGERAQVNQQDNTLGEYMVHAPYRPTLARDDRVQVVGSHGPIAR